MRTILVATDFSERSDRALRRGAMLAREAGGKLVLVHAIDDDQPQELLDAQSEKAAVLLARQSAMLTATDGVPCDHQLVLGKAFAAIAKATEDHQADLLVIGPHRRQILRDIFIGTTAERTVRFVQCPVLMANAPTAGRYRRVLFATDLSEPSKEAIRAATTLGIVGSALRSYLYVFDAPSLRLAMSHTLAADTRDEIQDAARTEATRRLSEFTANLGAAAGDLIVRYDEMTPAVEILAAAADISADLVVVGTRGRTGVARLLLGSVAEEVLRRADRDVLAVPSRVEE